MKKNKLMIKIMPLLASCLVLASCGEKEVKKYTITFKQNGYQDITRVVNEGENLTDIPTPKQKIGYTTMWETTTFSNVKEDKIVNALINPNIYTATYSAPGLEIDGKTVDLTYETRCTYLDMSLTKPGFSFLGWSYNDIIYTNNSIWNVASNVTLTAEWSENNKVLLMFVDLDGTTTYKTAYKGESLLDVPTPKEVTGYTVKWDVTDFSNLQQNMTIHATKTANVYTATYSDPDVEIDGQTVELTYDSPCTNLNMSVTKDDHILLGWKYGEATYTNESIWNVPNDVILTADWKEKDKLVVSFKDTNGNTINKLVKQSGTLTDIPTPSAKTGYIVDANWYADQACTVVASFANLTADMTVYSKVTAKSFEITLNPDGGYIEVTTLTVTFDQDYSLEAPEKEDAFFDTWSFNGKSVPLSGKWKVDSDSNTIELIALYGESDWTEYY